MSGSENIAWARIAPAQQPRIWMTAYSIFRRRLLTDSAQFLAQRDRVQRCDRQFGEELDSGFKFLEGFAEREGFVRIGAFDRGRVSDSPVSGHRLSGPYRTHFAGCVVVISHDRWFLDRIATHLLIFEGDSRVRWFEGNYQEYVEDYKLWTDLAPYGEFANIPLPLLQYRIHGGQISAGRIERQRDAHVRIASEMLERHGCTVQTRKLREFLWPSDSGVDKAIPYFLSSRVLAKDINATAPQCSWLHMRTRRIRLRNTVKMAARQNI